jgi:outer membrane receptor protein involved in Fe transport
MRWALLQDRLADSDVSDERIPRGGTPGFAVVDLRAGYRWQRNVIASVVAENVLDAPYRYHGSSVNGPGRGVIVDVEFGW